MKSNLEPGNEAARKDQYASVLNCCQRHICRPNGYCQGKKGAGCRFGFPKPLSPITDLIFIETKHDKDTIVHAELVLARNDQYLNECNKLQCEMWLANVDMSIIVDYNAAIR
jgi:hypothetical protein